MEKTTKVFSEYTNFRRQNSLLSVLKIKAKNISKKCSKSARSFTNNSKFLFRLSKSSVVL